MNEIHLDGKSKDIVSENISKLQEIFPYIFEDGKINFNKLKSDLGEYVDDSNERYDFSWPGKSDANKESQKRSSGTLRPYKDESKNWDTTKNLYIEGDNLEVLKILQKSYYNKIKMIYIDPPYNTGKDFIYSDNYQDNISNYLMLTGQLATDSTKKHQIKLSSNTDSSGRYHSNWLNMMYPRIKLSRNLLTEDGVIFISIDDNEVENLKKLCNEIFGEENFISQLNWKRQGGRQDSKYYAVVHEYILVYAKNIDNFVAGEKPKEKGIFPKFDETKQRNYKTQLLRKWGSNSKRSDRPNLFYPIKAPDGSDLYPMLSDTEEGCWRWGKSTMQKNIDDGNIDFVKKGDNWIAYEKIYEPLPGEEPTMKFNTWIDDINSGSGSTIIKSLFNNHSVFDYPKPIDLINILQKMANVKDGSLILDFFSGSATTSESVMRYNVENKSNNHFILVQIPEITDEKSEAYKAGFENICEIGKERIRRAGDKIVEESGNSDLDIGFKVFKLDTSNLEKWDPDYNNLNESLIIDNIKPDRNKEDLIYELILKYGLDLTLPIQKENNIYSIGYGALIICLEESITNENINEIANQIIKITNKSSVSRVIFKDSSFNNKDSVKTNVKEILSINNIDEFITI